MSGKASVASSSVLEKKLFADTYADIATKKVRLGQIINLRGHTVNGVGGGSFVVVNSAGLTADTGNISGTGSAGLFAVRRNAKKTPYEFGYQDGAVDASVTINACSLAHGLCNLDGGKVYNIQYQLNVIKLHGVGGKKAILNLTSPTGDGKFGAPYSGFSNTAAVMCLGAVGNPLEGVDIREIQVECNAMVGATGGVGIKGFLFARCKDFYQRSCLVKNCASYAYWDYDVSGTGSTYCNGTRDDCSAIDCAVSFEQVNVRGVRLNNCNGYISNAVLPYSPENIFHAYGGSDMRVSYNNCVGIADGPCPVVFAALLECKNISIDSCQFLNRYNNGANVQASVFFEATGGNFDNINFKNCTLTSLYSTAVTLTNGANGSPNAAFAFTDCRISGKSIGVAFFGTGGVYSFNNCITRGDSIGGGQAYAYIRDVSSTATVNVTGGSAVGAGGVSPQASNLPPSSFNRTAQTPNVNTQPVIRQQKFGSAVLEVDSGYSQVVVGFNNATLNANKVVVTGIIDATGSSGATALGLATLLSVAALGNQNYRFFAAQSAAGRVINYCMTEYE